MSYEAKNVLICISAPSGAAGNPGICPEGQMLATQTLYVPTSDPSVPTLDDVTVGTYAFAIVLASYLFALGLGQLFNLFRND